jgi:hypothetical protein
LAGRRHNPRRIPIHHSLGQPRLSHSRPYSWHRRTGGWGGRGAHSILQRLVCQIVTLSIARADLSLSLEFVLSRTGLDVWQQNVT